MASFGRQLSATSPVLTLSAQHPGQPTPVNFSIPASKSIVSAISSTSNCKLYSQNISTMCSSAGRKRSREDAASNLNDDYPQSAQFVPPKEAEEDWIYGEGMVLIKPNGRGYVADASSQSGTWLEQNSPENGKLPLPLTQDKLDGQDRPPLRSYKSQRLDQTAERFSQNEIPLSSGVTSRTTASPSFESRSIATDATSQPIIDDFTLHLGIGWRRISDDEDVQAAARGWARFIENHYPLSSVKLCLESKGLQAYLIEAAQGYFLFAENLRHGRLVSKNVDGALRNLKTMPPVFDGEEMTATEIPSSKHVRGSTANLWLGDIEMSL